MSAPVPGSPTVVLYSRKGCSPCFVMQREATRAARRAGLRLRIVEVSGDPLLESRYGAEVPVLVMPGGETIQGRFVPGEVEDAFRRAAGVHSIPSRPPAAPDQATRRRAGLVGGLMAFLGWRGRPQA